MIGEISGSSACLETMHSRLSFWIKNLCRLLFIVSLVLKPHMAEASYCKPLVAADRSVIPMTVMTEMRSEHGPLASIRNGAVNFHYICIPPQGDRAHPSTQISSQSMAEDIGSVTSSLAVPEEATTLTPDDGEFNSAVVTTLTTGSSATSIPPTTTLETTLAQEATLSADPGEVASTGSSSGSSPTARLEVAMAQTSMAASAVTRVHSPSQAGQLTQPSSTTQANPTASPQHSVPSQALSSTQPSSTTQVISVTQATSLSRDGLTTQPSSTTQANPTASPQHSAPSQALLSTQPSFATQVIPVTQATSLSQDGLTPQASESTPTQSRSQTASSTQASSTTPIKSNTASPVHPPPCSSCEMEDD